VAPVYVNCIQQLYSPTWLSVGCDAMRFLISDAIVMNACSTLVAFFADVSRNGMPISSANAFAGR
jgi:hypothetical protein